MPDDLDFFVADVKKTERETEKKIFFLKFIIMKMVRGLNNALYPDSTWNIKKML